MPPIEVVRVTQGRTSDLDPVLGLDQDGRPLLAWARYYAEVNRVGVQTAQAPQFAPQAVESLPLADRENARLFLGPGGEMVWAIPSLGGWAIHRATALGPAESSDLQQYPAGASLAMDGQGRLHLAWAEGAIISHIREDQPSPALLDVGVSVGDLSLSVDAAGVVCLAWVAGDTGSVWASCPEDGLPSTPVADSGRSPRIVRDGAGQYHLFWLTDGGLYVASSADWASPVVVSSDVRDWASVAILADLNGAQVVWAEGGYLWHSYAPQWRGARRALVEAHGVQGLSGALEESGRLHLAWSALDEGVRDLYYATFQAWPQQLVVMYPADGDVVADGDLIRVAFSRPSDAIAQVDLWAEVVGGADDGDLIAIGTIHASSDGWSLPLNARMLDPLARYRFVARATDRLGRVYQAEGGTFRVAPPEGDLYLSVSLGEDDSYAGRHIAYVLPSRALGPGSTLMLSLVPVGPGADLRRADTASHVVVVGTSTALAAGEGAVAHWETLPFDTRRVSDGAYWVVVTAHEPDGALGRGLVEHPIQIDNTLAPTVRVRSPMGDVLVEDTLVIEAQASSARGEVTRVEFLLEEPAATGVSGQAMWLAEGVLSDDGVWRAQVPISGRLDGDCWTVRAVAYDADGLRGVARSEGCLTIIGAERPYLHLATPAEESVLRGRRRVNVHVPRGEQLVQALDLFAWLEGGDLQLLGKMRLQAGRWTLDWDTRSLPDGVYALQAISRLADGATFATQLVAVTICNEVPALLFDSPDEGAELTGLVALRLATPPGVAAISSLATYYRDSSGQLFFAGQGHPDGSGWRALWDTRAALDGDYTLVALAHAPGGAVARVEREVRVRNTSPEVRLLSGGGGERLRGQVSVAWEAASPLDLPLTVGVAYSPDGGASWWPVSSGLPATHTLAWDTRLFPDALEGYLRVCADDGARVACATSPSLQVNNSNQAPSVSIQAPTPGDPLGQSIRLVWRAHDRDRDALDTRIEYRRGSGPWLLLDEQSPDLGEYTWVTGHLPPAADYAVRVTAHDAWGAVGVDTAGGLWLTGNTPPMVEILAPRPADRLVDEAVVLWRTADAEGDALSIDLLYSDDAGLTWLPLVEGLPDLGYYVWQFSFLPSGDAYRLGVIARDAYSVASDESEPFSIGPSSRPSIALHQPDVGAVLSRWQTITWSVEGAEQGRSATLSVRAQDSDDWHILADEVPDQGRFLWDTTAHTDGEYELRLVITDDRVLYLATRPRLVMIRNDVASPLVVSLDTPRGGERWHGLHEVSWQVAGEPGGPTEAALYLSADGGDSWRLLDAVDLYAGHYMWDTARLSAGGAYLLRLTVTDGQARISDRSPGVFQVSGPGSLPVQARFLSPADSSGSLIRGNVVAWTVMGDAARVQSIALDLSDDGGLTWREYAAGLAPRDRLVLDELCAGPTYLARLRVDARDHSVQVLAAPFDLAHLAEGLDGLQVDAPMAGEVWSGFRQVLWPVARTASAGVSVGIELSDDGGRTWQTVTDGFPDLGVYDLDTHGLSNGIYLVRVTARDGSRRACATSAPFRVSNPGRGMPVVSTVAPQGGEIWSGAREVSWHTRWPGGEPPASFTPRTATLDYSIDGGMTWEVVARDMPDAGRYIWDTTRVPNTPDLWLRVSVSDGSLEGRVVAGPLAVFNAEVPRLTLTLGPETPVWTGLQWLSWQTDRHTGQDVSVELQVSTSGGRIWQTLGRGLDPAGSYLWDTASVREGSEVLVRAIANLDGKTASVFTAGPVTVRGNVPRALP